MTDPHEPFRPARPDEPAPAPTPPEPIPPAPTPPAPDAHAHAWPGVPTAAAGPGDAAYPSAIGLHGLWDDDVAPARGPVRRRRGVGAVATLGLVLVALAAGALGGAAYPYLTRAQVVEIQVAADTERATLVAGTVAATADDVIRSVVSLEVRGQTGVSTGSGFVLSADGYIVTNNHVVSAADAGAVVTVILWDGSEHVGELVGRTVNYDLAVLRIEHDELDALVLGDSDAVVVGDAVIAVGAPLGLDGTVTTGIVSAKNRPVVAGGQAEQAFINAIQTDAAINPGNSGGPLVNAAGEVIGINSAIAQPPGRAEATGSVGLGFAIPSNQVRRTAAELIETGQATYPVIGVLLDTSYVGEGVQVVTDDAAADGPAVSPDGPADRAGIVPGDVILAIDGRPVTQPDELIVAIRAKAPGDAVLLSVRTGDGDAREVRMDLDEAVSN